MDAKPIIVKLDALRAYHSIDRALYAILVTELWRDPVESLQIIALWLWLEQVGFGKVTRKILTCSPLFINQTAEEAILCLKCIKDSLFIFSTEATDTKNLVSISYKIFNEPREGVAGATGAPPSAPPLDGANSMEGTSDGGILSTAKTG
ncbi:uncharacterized protein Fot_43103 [Forsythia ovata]|uniref:Reverse transcriptase domain-containing protein n=1 Tax=Forsythia ovata TaxID=205694 RepID=A0ABD1RNR5_9LAMI